MENTDALWLARAQFGLNIAFHILFVSISLALSWILVYLRIQYARTGKARWRSAFNLWTRVFALTFAVGVVSGIVMSFQFGTNWPGYMNTVGNIAGPLLAFEVLTAFFLEAAFLGVMLYGFNRVPGWVHVGATLLVAIGTTVSAFWILALNSWMQTPVGYTHDGHELISASWLQVIFNPSFPLRLVHMLIASGVTAAFVVAGLSALRLLRAPSDKAAYISWRTGAVMAAVLAPAQALVGDLHGLSTLEHQPAKVAAMEALWETRAQAPLVLFATVNQAEQRNEHVIALPGFSSLILRHRFDGEVKGLKEFAPDIPPVAPVFYAFRVMVGLGVLMIALALWGVLRTRHGRQPSRVMLRIFALFAFSGWAAVVAGWMVTEIGRQPWLVYGMLRTKDAVGPISPARLGASLTAYLIVYGILLLSYIVVITHLARSGLHASSELHKDKALSQASAS
ncbi:MAG: cytochrome ubiquinol oxidase subunit I [Chromatiales bacterium]|nr:cytochrome ubiquinol oxidase subunit I [Chromatiales bacterium]